MIISKDGVTILELTETQKNIIKNDINSDDFESEIVRRLKYIIEHKIEQCMLRLKQEWLESGKLAQNGVSAIPINDLELADLIFSQPNYKCRKTRDLEMQQ